ncbi:MAG: neutral zinc metallopeptidase [Propionibacteriaceae bacterium]|nr:neutral zinc metallopeptidase [Propionibacteriaceae bacterium]
MGVLLIIAPTVASSISNLLQPTSPTVPTTAPYQRDPTTAPTVAGPTSTYSPPAGGGEGARLDQWPIDLDPDPVPYPATYDQLDSYLTANSIYDQTIEPVSCTVSGIDPSAPTDQIEDYLTGIVACLMDAWDNAVYQAGFELPRPSVTVYDDPEFTTRCGKAPEENAFYCSADQQLYYSRDLIESFVDSAQTRFLVDAVLAHEFGHTIQGRTGIMAAADWYWGEAADEAEEALWSRREEQQADCFAGLFLNSISQSSGMTEQDSYNVEELFYYLGDPPGGDHGLPESRAGWIARGLGSTSVATCDTFSVPASEVP